MQRFLLAAFTASLCVLSACTPQTPTVPANPARAFETRLEGDGVVIVKFLNRDAESVVVPAQIDGRPVVEIGEEAFANCDSLTSVEIANGVEKIGEGAFDGCADALTLYGAAGSVAQEYARENGFPFKAR